MIRRVVFFGASVTAQNRNQQGERTGYTANLKEMLAEADSGLEVHQHGLVGSHFDTGACICLRDIAGLLGPETLLVSEWHSTTLPVFHKSALKYYYDTLAASGTTVLNLVLPMKSALQAERRNIQQTRSAQGPRCFQRNLYREDLDLEACIRDDQHTTSFGGRAYAGIVFRDIMQIIEQGQGPQDPGESRPFQDAERPYPPLSWQPAEGVFHPGDRFLLQLPAERRPRVQVFAKVQKGPQTARLEIRQGTRSWLQDTWSKFSYYRNPWTSFSALTPELVLREEGPTELEIAVSPQIPDYRQLAEPGSKALAFMERQTVKTTALELAGGLYVRGAGDFSVRILRKGVRPE